MRAVYEGGWEEIALSLMTINNKAEWPESCSAGNGGNDDGR